MYLNFLVLTFMAKWRNPLPLRMSFDVKRRNEPFVLFGLLFGLDIDTNE